VLPLFAVLITAVSRRRRNRATLFKVFFFALLASTLIDVGMTAKKFENRQNANGAVTTSSAAQDNDDTPDITPENLGLWVAGYNKKLPKMVNPNTQLDTITVNGKVLSYSFTLVGQKVVNINIPGLYAASRAAAIRDLCADKSIKVIFKLGYSAHYFVNDEDKAPVFDYQVAAGDCPAG
jgi:hypothetical protein